MSLLTSPLHETHHRQSSNMRLMRLFSRSSRRDSNHSTQLNRTPSQSSTVGSTSTVDSTRSFQQRTPLSKSGNVGSSQSSTSATLTSPYPQPALSSLSPLVNPSPPTRRPNVDHTTASGTPTEPPPAYTPPIAETADDPFAFLANFDTVFLVDDSGSMAGRSWRETGTALAAIAPICAARDQDGVDLHFLNHPRSFTNITSAAMIEQAFKTVRPGGGTPTGTRLHSLLKPYLARVQEQTRLTGEAVRNGTALPAEIKPMNIIVITDGVPSDDVESVIMQAARKLEACEAPAWQVGIQFFQVGHEPGAAEALQELDDDLVGENCPRDIVDTVPMHKSRSTGSELHADKILKCMSILFGAYS